MIKLGYINSVSCQRQAWLSKRVLTSTTGNLSFHLNPTSSLMTTAGSTKLPIADS